MLEVVEYHLVTAGFRCSTIRGDVPAKKRADLVDAFNNDPNGPEVNVAYRCKEPKLLLQHSLG